VTLGEDGTPLVQLCRDGLDLCVKMESQSPTGSFKDKVRSDLLPLRGLLVIPVTGHGLKSSTRVPQ